MKTKTIENDITEFHGAMVAAQRDLDAFSHSFNASLGGVAKELDALPALAKGLRRASDEPAAGLVNGEVDGWTAQLAACAKVAREAITGREFQNRFQKQPLVVVFGPVKAGKSTLGNFMLGKAFREAPFDNPYRSGAIPKAKIVVEESGRPDAKTKEWFDVNTVINEYCAGHEEEEEEEEEEEGEGDDKKKEDKKPEETPDPNNGGGGSGEGGGSGGSGEGGGGELPPE